MASSAERDQVLLGIIAALAAKFLVVNLQVRPGPATLASPAVAAQHLFPELVVRARDQAASAVAWVESGSRSLLGHFVQKSLPLFARQKFEEP